MKTVYLVASGDLRLSANQECWPTQEKMEEALVAAFRKQGARIKRAHPYDPIKKHGFIDSQKYGMAVFKSIPPKAPVVVAESVWQYTHHVLPGLMTHTGPILTVGNWDGTYPGLVGTLNLNGSLAKAGVPYSSLWSEDFKDKFFRSGLAQWIKRGKIKQDTSQVRPLRKVRMPWSAAKLGRQVARELRENKAIMGIFDEGCMGMYNAIVPDELLNSLGIYKERLSQSALFARMQSISDSEAAAVFEWLENKGMRFDFGTDEATELTRSQSLLQCKMYIAALRMADEFGCATIGIQYQQGLKDLCPASDLVEGLLNNVDRPPAFDLGGKELYAGEALPHFNEVDECAGIDGLVTNRLWRRMGLPPENTLHDVRWGRTYKLNGKEQFVWVLEISGAVPPAHLVDGYRGAVSERQPAMYFPQGGGSIKGISKPGWVVWSRVFVENNRLNMDTGLAESVELPSSEVETLWQKTTFQWPMMLAVLQGVSRDQMMARHKANHIQVVYAPDRETAHQAMMAKAAAMDELGVDVSICGKYR